MAEARGGGPEGGEHDGEAGDEAEHPAEQRGHVAPVPRLRARPPTGPRPSTRRPGRGAARRARGRTACRPRRPPGARAGRPRWWTARPGRRHRHPGPRRRPGSAPCCARTSSRSASTIMATRSANETVGLPAQLGAGLGGVAHQEVDLGRPEEPLVDDDVLVPVEADVAEGLLAQVRAPSGSRRWPPRSRRARRAGASATWPARSRRRNPSRAGRRGCRASSLSSSPPAMRATPWVTLRVTNSSPRRGLSWLKSMPDEACRP